MFRVEDDDDGIVSFTGLAASTLMARNFRSAEFGLRLFTQI